METILISYCVREWNTTHSLVKYIKKLYSFYKYSLQFQLRAVKDAGIEDATAGISSANAHITC